MHRINTGSYLMGTWVTVSRSLLGDQVGGGMVAVSIGIISHNDATLSSQGKHHRRPHTHAISLPRSLHVQSANIASVLLRRTDS